MLLVLVVPNTVWAQDSTSNEVAVSADGVVSLAAVEIQDSVEQEVRSGARPAFAQTIASPELRSVNAWLESANGVYGNVSSKGTRSVMVRGFDTHQLSFAFNGMPLETGYAGMTGLDALPMNWISAGRIAHADNSPTDGAGLGGKIEFYAFDPSVFEATLQLSPTSAIAAASHGMRDGAWRWAFTAGGEISNGFVLSHAFEATRDEDGGLREASGRRGVNVLGRVGRSLSDWGDLEVMVGWAQTPRDVPTGLDAGERRFWRYTNWREAFALATLRFDTAWVTGKVQVWANDQGNTLEAFDDAWRTTQNSSMASTTVWQDDDVGLKLELAGTSFDLGDAGFLNWLLRTDLRYQRHASDEQLYATASTVQKRVSRLYYDVRPALEWMVTPDINLFVAGNVVGAQPISWQRLPEDVTAGAPDDVVNGGFSFGLDANFGDALSAHLRAARRLRLPTLKEQFGDAPETIGVDVDPLRPEVAWDLEAELHWKPLNTVALSVGVFDTEIRDLIEYKYVNGLKMSYNVNEARLAGTDIALKLGAWAGVSFDLSYHYLYAYDLVQDHVLNERPAHNVRASVTYEPVERLKLTLGTQFESKRRTEAWMGSKYAWLGNVILLNAEVAYQFEHFSMYLVGTNLTDYNYARTLGYPEPGINVVLGVKAAW